MPLQTIIRLFKMSVHNITSTGGCVSIEGQSATMPRCHRTLVGCPAAIFSPSRWRGLGSRGRRSEFTGEESLPDSIPDQSDAGHRSGRYGSCLLMKGYARAERESERRGRAVAPPGITFRFALVSPHHLSHLINMASRQPGGNYPVPVRMRSWGGGGEGHDGPVGALRR